MTVTRSTFPALLWPGIQAIFGQSYEKLDKEYTRIFDVRTSRKAYEKVAEATGLGLAAVKSEGGSIFYDTPSPGATSLFTHVTYGLGYIITREAEEDNQYQEVAEGNAASLPWSMNIITAADLSEASLEDGLSTLMAATNSAGLPIALRAVRLIVSPGQIFNATRILQSDSRVGTANNDLNAIKTLGLVPEIVVNHYLTDTDAWYLQTNVPNGLISYQRRALELRDDSDFDTENHKHKATERYSAG
jgi:hypothetical protein